MAVPATPPGRALLLAATGSSLHFDGAVDGAHEPEARHETHRAGDHQEAQAQQTHVAKVHHRRHRPRDVQFRRNQCVPRLVYVH